MTTLEKEIVCITFILSALASVYFFKEIHKRKSIKEFSAKDWFLTSMPMLLYLCNATYVVVKYR